MSLKLSVGLSKKVGQPDYGSLGASCGVEVELDPSLLQVDLDGFHARVRDAFIACQQAVNDELARLGSSPTPPRRESPTDPPRSSRRPGRGATDAQIRAIRTLADRHRLDLVAILRERFAVANPDQLAIGEASRLIDELKAETASR
jgi:hypothetical protein